MLAGSSPSWISSFSTLRFCAAYSSARLSIAAGSILALRILSPPPWPVSARKPPLRRFYAATERGGGLFLRPTCNCQNGTARRGNTLPAAPVEQKDFKAPRRGDKSHRHRSPI